MTNRPYRRFLSSLTLSALVTAQLATGVFPIPISPTPKAHAEAGFTTSKSVNKTSAQPGENITYTVHIQNTGGSQLTNIWIIDQVPAGLTYNAALSDPRCFLQGNEVKCGNTPINPGAGDDYSFVFTVNQNATCGSLIKNTANVLADGTSIIGTNEVSTGVNCPGPNLRVMKTPSTPSVPQGGSLTYTVEVFNDGTLAVPNVRINDPVPAGMTYDDAGSTASCTLIGNTVVCGPVTVNPNGGFQMFVLAFTVNQNAPCGTVSNTAEATMDNTPVAWSNQATVTVTCTPTNADVEIYKTGPAQPMRGTTILYNINVKNNGPATATNIRVSDPIPSVLKQEQTFTIPLIFKPAQSDASCSVTGNTVNCNVGTLANGATRSLTIAFELPFEAFCSKAVVNTATVTSDTTDPTPSNNSSTTAGSVNCATSTLDLVKAGPQTARIGDLITYSIAVTNNLNFNTTRNRLIDPVPDHLEFVSANDNICTYYTNGNQVICGEFDLAAHASRIFQLTFRVKQTAPCNQYITNIADTWSQQPGIDPKWSNPVRTRIECGGNTFTISKTDYRTTASAGDTLTYVIVVTNVGSSNATSVEVTDPIPSRTTYVSASDGGQLNGSNVRWTFPLNAGASKTLTLQVRIDSSLNTDTTIYNIATVTNGPSASDTTLVEFDDNRNGDIQISVNDDPDPIDICYDDKIEYDIRLTNSGNSNETVDLEADLDGDTDYRSSSDGGRERSNSRVEWNNIKVSRNSSRTVRLRVRVDTDMRDGDTVRVDVRIRGGDSDTEVTRIRNICDTPPPNSGTPDLTIDKTADHTEALPGTSVTYTVTIRNPGNADIANATLEDQYPSQYLTIIDAGGGNDSSGTIRWNLGTLRRNSTTIVRYRARVKEGLTLGTSILNTATVRGNNLTRSDTHTIVVPRPPQTGLGGFLKSLGGNDQYITERNEELTSDTSSQDSALPMIVWMTTILTGLAAGGAIGRKFLL
ncbi:DUF11 domain-containing protein [Candidatus Peregrinibacteria bacterium]|nr:DUF11 domain-containing protein [Candidatus Peregrinibacteria bacterium]